MIIPPVALAIGTVVVAVKILLTGQIDTSNDVEIPSKSERSEPQKSVLLSDCRFQSEQVPHRDLTPSTREGEDGSATNTEESDPFPQETDVPNKLNHTDQNSVEQFKMDSEVPERTAT